MKIRNTDVESRHPWPEGVFVQGGSAGIVLRPAESGGNYRTAFVEATPPGTFIRGEGETIEAAEGACWAKYQQIVTCDGGGEHGPYEPRQYDNGAGFCVKCGAWFVNVCEPSMERKVERLACDFVQARWGRDVVVTSKWEGLVADEKARIWAQLHEVPQPESTTEDPTPAELEAVKPRPFTPEELATAHAAMERVFATLVAETPPLHEAGGKPR